MTYIEVQIRLLVNKKKYNNPLPILIGFLFTLIVLKLHGKDMLFDLFCIFH